MDVLTVCGRPAIHSVYEAHPPTDALLVVEASQEGDRDTVTFSWSRGGAGAMEHLLAPRLGAGARRTLRTLVCGYAPSAASTQPGSLARSCPVTA